MRTNYHRAATAALLLAGALALSSAAGADWLVGRDGSRVETKGAWTVKGNIVTFTMPNGTLASMKLSTVDLEASARVTAEVAQKASEAAAPPAPAAVERKAPVLVLTDKDVSHVNPETGEAVAAGKAEGETAGEAAAPTSPAGDVVVTAWDKGYSDAEGGITIKGTVRNRGKHPALGIGVTVKIYDSAGKLAGSAPASLSAETLKPGQAANFNAVLPGVHIFTAAKLEVVSTPVLSHQEGEPMESEAPPPQP